MIKYQIVATASGGGCDVVGPLLHNKEVPDNAETKDGEQPT
jgi:hypothetical protein